MDEWGAGEISDEAAAGDDGCTAHSTRQTSIIDMDPAVAAAEEEQKKNAGGYRYWARNVPDSQRLPRSITSVLV